MDDKALSAALSRRRFIAGAAGAVASLGLGVRSLSSVPVALASVPQSQGVIVPDPSLCIGCLTCEVACSRWHAEQGRSGLPRIRVVVDPKVKPAQEILARYPLAGSFTQFPCKMCPSPECQPVCPVNAIQFEQSSAKGYVPGARYIDESKCIGCGKCYDSCPYKTEGVVPDTETELRTKRVVGLDRVKNVYVKCDLCRGRAEGPICVERCPINIAIRENRIKSDHLCLDLKPVTETLFKGLP